MPEFRFKIKFTIPDDQVHRYHDFLADETRCAPHFQKMDIVYKNDRLIEVETPSLSTKDFTTNALTALRHNALNMIQDIDLSYNYYGTHIIARNFCSEDLIECRKLDSFNHYAIAKNESHPDNVYIDPFVNKEFMNQSIIMVSKNDVKEELWNHHVNQGSYQAMLNMIDLVPAMKKLLRWGPVPGGTLRIGEASQLELVVGLLPWETESSLISYMRCAILQKTSSALSRGYYVPIFLPEHQYGFSFLSGITYTNNEIGQLDIPSIPANLKSNIAQNS